MRFEQLIADIDKIRCFRRNGQYTLDYVTYDLVHEDGLYARSFLNVVRGDQNEIIFLWHDDRLCKDCSLEEVINNSSSFIQEALLFNLDILRVKFVDFD